ncbi:chemotaxis protein CheR [Caenimonas sp. S4]|nr:chemotaxis protein CheR [Caenimonas soli]
MHDPVRQPPWAHLSEFVADRIGLHFPRERWDDLQRGLSAAAQELGFQDPGWLLSRAPTKAQLEVLASHLTIGETYFFRDWQAMQALSQTILPELIRSRRGRAQQLRIWSAGCCSGEEPYSMAILLHQALPDLRDWQVSITATDINPRFLQKAAAGVYSEWSFRNAPVELRERYFKRTADGRFAIHPQIREMVKFSPLNLAHDAYPPSATDNGPMDIVLCRNVLMYFTPAQIQKVIGKFHQTVAEGGWLVVSPSEASQALFRQFVPVNFPGAVFYQKRSAPRPAALEAGWLAKPSLACYTPGVDTPPAAPAKAAPDSPAPAALARALANQGKLGDALAWCDRWIAADKLNAGAHYLRATVLLEQDEPEQARSSLQRAIYLQPDFVLAHFALGNLARVRNRPSEASKHFANTSDLLSRYQAGDLLAESGGLTAGTLALTLSAITGPAHTHE